MQDLSDNIIYAALRESSEKWVAKPGSVVPVMIEAMNRGLDQYKDVDEALKADNFDDPLMKQHQDALQLYASKIEAHYEAYGEYPIAMTLPKPTNDGQRYAWILAEAFLQHKTGKKPRLQAA